MIVIDTIGKLREFRHPLVGWCRPCGARYRMNARPEDIPPSSWEVDLAALIAERGPDHPVVGMAPVRCLATDHGRRASDPGSAIESVSDDSAKCLQISSLRLFATVGAPNPLRGHQAPPL